MRICKKHLRRGLSLSYLPLTTSSRGEEGGVGDHCQPLRWRTAKMTGGFGSTQLTLTPPVLDKMSSYDAWEGEEGG